MSPAEKAQNYEMRQRHYEVLKQTIVKLPGMAMNETKPAFPGERFIAGIGKIAKSSMQQPGQGNVDQELA